MPEPLSTDLLERVIGRVLEEAAFVFASPPEDVVEPPSDGVVARLRFSGPRSGHIVLALPGDLAAEVASNLLGVDDLEEANGSVEDAVGELLNMVGGVLCAEWWGEAGDGDLGTPEVELAPWPTLSGSCRATLMTDEDQPIEVSVLMDP